MVITEEMITSVLEKYHTGIDYVKFVTDDDQQRRHLQLLGVIGLSIQTNFDVMFDFLRQGVNSIISNVNALVIAIEVIQDALPDTLNTNQPIDSTRSIDQVVSGLQRAEDTLTYSGRMGNNDLALMRTGVSAFVEELRPTIMQSSSFRLSAAEARSRIFDVLDEVKYLWKDIVEDYIGLIGVATSWAESKADVAVAKVVVAAVLEEMTRIQWQAEDAEPSDRANAGLDDFLHVTLAESAIDDILLNVSPISNKVDTGTAQAQGTSSAATLPSTRSAPYLLDSSADTLNLLSDEVNTQLFTLPHAPAAEMYAGNVENYVVTSGTKGSISATIVGPYTTVVKATQTDMVTTAGSMVVSSAAAAFVAALTIGDFIRLSGPVVLDAYVAGVINNTTLLLDRPVPSTNVAVTYSAYADNRVTVMSRSTKYVVALSVGIGIAFATWAGELTLGLAGGATISSLGGLITITEAQQITTGEESVIAANFVALSPMSAMGFPTSQGQGVGGNPFLGFTSDTGSSTISVPPATYTAANLSTTINGLVAAGTWDTVSHNGYIVFRSTSLGQNSTLMCDVSNTVVGVSAGLNSTGDSISGEDVAKYITATSTFGVIAEHEEEVILSSDQLSTSAGSQIVQDTSVDFVAAGIISGDVVHTQSGTHLGYYHVSVVALNSLTLDAVDFLAASVGNQSEVKYNVIRSTLNLTSSDISLASALEVLGGTALTVLGMSVGEVRGKVTTIELLDAEGALVDLEEANITDNDELRSVVPALNADIIDVATYVLTLEDAVDNNFISTQFIIRSKSLTQYLTLEASLQTWVSNKLILVENGAYGMSQVINLISRALNTNSPVFVGDALISVALLLDVLSGVGGILPALTEYTPAELDDTESARRMLLDENADRTLENITLGRYRDAFSTSISSANTARYMSDMIRYGGRLLNIGTDVPDSLSVSVEEIDDR